VETPGIANEEEIQAVHKWLRDQPKTFFVEGIRKLMDRGPSEWKRKETM
jgi:hypothetical protein